MSKYDKFLGGTITEYSWNRERWEERKERFVSVWDKRTEFDRKCLIGLLVYRAHQGVVDE